ncbi:lipid-transfer protein [Amycolatopsis pigmentata]|uniref:propanoyl-CoA C-acyltransferase n=1 Tax=Amycolatopsis pigmentata TaxID=450801 RepID=A0ABW5G5S7_9PSEU
MAADVRVAGVGMVPFTKPSAGAGYEDMGVRAVRAALADSGIAYEDVQEAYASYIYGDSTCGQVVLYSVGLSGIPIVNVNNNCASGSTALWQARKSVASGDADVVLAVGFEQMRAGALRGNWDDRQAPSLQHFVRLNELYGFEAAEPPAAQLFAGAGRAHMEKFGTSIEAFARIAVKARKHAANNPYAVFTEPLTVEEVLASPHQAGPLTRLMCCPPTSGAAAAILVSAEYAKKKGLDARVRIAGQGFTSDTPGSFTGDMRHVVGYDLSAKAAADAYAQAGIGPDDIPVVELHDCFTANELITYESLGLTAEGTAEKFIFDGDNTYGGRVVTNPSGGLMSKGHPIGATGLAQCAELTWQLRGTAGDRQVTGVRTALQHNIGIGSACVVTVYEGVD